MNCLLSFAEASLTLGFGSKAADIQELDNETIFTLKENTAEYSGLNSLYDICDATLHKPTTPDLEIGRFNRWAQDFHSYDCLAYFNTDLFVQLAGWNTEISSLSIS